MRYRNDILCGDRLEFELEQTEPLDRIRITTPSGRVDVIEPFIKRPVRFEYDDDGLECAIPEGEDRLCCRYTPLEPGHYFGEALSAGYVCERLSFTARGPASHGCIGVSKRDSRYFTYSDGTPYLPIGINLTRPESWNVSDGSEFGLGRSTRTLGLSQYGYWLRRCAENGVNMVRLWLGDPYFDPDTEEANVLRLEQYAKLDALFELARQYGIVLKLTIEQFRFMDYRRESNPEGGYADRIHAIFNKRLWDRGRRCESTQEWAQDEHWRAMWLRKVRELSLRYAGDPSLFAVELWNEMNCLQVDSMDVFLDWNRDMLPRVKALFPDNMVVNSLGSLDAEGPLEYYRRFCWDRCDFKQMHRYFDRGAAFQECGEDPILLIKKGLDLIRDDTRPLLVAETGAVNRCHSGPYLYYGRDNRGLLFADTVYTPLFCGAAGCGNIWHWDSYVQQKDLYGMFAPLARLTAGIAFDSEDFTCEDLTDEKLSVLILKGNGHILGYIRCRDDNWRTNFLRDREPLPADGDYPMPEGRLSVFNIWPGESGGLELKNGRLYVEALKYGVMFRIDRVEQP